MAQPNSMLVEEGQVSLCYHHKKTTSRSTHKQRFNAYNGQNGKACQIKEFIKGTPPYRAIFSQDGTANCSPDGATEHSLVMNACLSRRAASLVPIQYTGTQQCLSWATSPKFAKKKHRELGRAYANSEKYLLWNVQQKMHPSHHCRRRGNVSHRIAAVTGAQFQDSSDQRQLE